ncbi:MAG: FBP domain-containing protein [Pseudomonadota bacterium]
MPDLNLLPWSNLDYLGWVHPGGHLGYLVVLSPNDGRLKGVILRRSRFSGTRKGMEMCSLCHHMHRPNGTAMFTLTRQGSDTRHSIGNIVCKDLDCSLRIRNLVDTAAYVPETLYPEAKIWRMQLALHRWLKSANRL